VLGFEIRVETIAALTFAGARCGHFSIFPHADLALVGESGCGKCRDALSSILAVLDSRAAGQGSSRAGLLEGRESALKLFEARRCDRARPRHRDDLFKERDVAEPGLQQSATRIAPKRNDCISNVFENRKR